MSWNDQDNVLHFFDPHLFVFFLQLFTICLGRWA